MSKLKCFLYINIFVSLVYPIPCISNSLEETTSPLDSLYKNFESLEADSLKVRALVEMSNVLREDDFKKSLDYSLEALQLAEQLGDDRLILLSTINLAITCLQKGLYEQAVYHFSSQLEIGERLKDKEVIGKAYYNLGLIRLILEDYEEADKLVKRGNRLLLEHYEESGNEWSLNQQLSIKNSMAIIAKGLENFSLAEKFFLESLKKIDGKSGYEKLFVQIANNYADFLISQDRLTEAGFYLNKIEEIQITFPSKPNRIVLLLSKGKLEYLSLNYDKALSYFTEGYGLAKELEGLSHKKHLTSELSEVFSKMGQLDSSLYYLNLRLNYEDSLKILNAKEELLKSELLLQYNEAQASIKAKYEKTIQSYVLVILLGLIGLVGLVLLYFQIRKKYQNVHSQHIDLLDKNESIKKNNKLLRTEIDLKQQEMTWIQIESLKKSEILSEFSLKLQQSADQVDENTLVKLKSDLKSAMKEKSWYEFELLLKNIPGQFYENLIQNYPDLTMNERRLCAFLKLQMTTKEIAALTGQSVRAIEAGRTRLRKKLGITNSEISLYDFFINESGVEN